MMDSRAACGRMILSPFADSIGCPMVNVADHVNDDIVDEVFNERGRVLGEELCESKG